MCNEFLMFDTPFFIYQGFISKALILGDYPILGKWTTTAIYGHQVFQLLITLFVLCFNSVPASRFVTCVITLGE